MKRSMVDLGRYVHLTLLTALVLVPGAVLYAQAALSVTVTPPLFQLSVGPGETWSSSLKVVNNNPYPVTYYARLVDFKAHGEDGSSTFIPLLEETRDTTARTYSLASWIALKTDPIPVEAGKSANLPFSIRIPEDAEPGGHYAAILVGTEPGDLGTSGSRMKISSYVSSLIFVRIKGEASEIGRIREFHTTKEIYDSPSADFVLRFENLGTTHLKPRGDVTLYNMWGKERGKVYINQNGNFGNVLPKSIRRFEFSWDSEPGLFDIGLYSAVVTLSFGDDAKQNISATGYFWIVPTVPVAIVLVSFTLFMWFIIWFIKSYIRRALLLERRRLGIPEDRIHPDVPATYSLETLVEPLRVGVIDLREATLGVRPEVLPARLENVDATPSTSSQEAHGNVRTLSQFVRTYRMFLVFITLLMLVIIPVSWYFSRVLVAERHYDIHDIHALQEASTTLVQ